MGRLRAGIGAVAAVMASFVIAAPAEAAPAAITGAFADSCRDFSAHASKVGSSTPKDISHVVLYYADGRVVKDETINAPDFAINGGVGDELTRAVVKSGTTTTTFPCTRTTTPPTALLEVSVGQGCVESSDGFVGCDGHAPRTAWVHSRIPELGYGIVWFNCGWPDDQACVDHEMPCGQLDFYSLCRVTYTYRGTSSFDADGDIVSWTIDFGDGTSTGGDWATNPPTAVAHEYLRHHCPVCDPLPATLTVTDAAGHTASDAVLVDHQYPN